MILALYGPNSLIGGFLADLGIQVIFTPIAIVLALVHRDVAVRRAQRAAGAAGARPGGGGGGRNARRDPHGPPSAGSCCRRSARRSSAGTLLTFARCLGEFGSVVLVVGEPHGSDPHGARLHLQLDVAVPAVEAAAVATLLFAHLVRAGARHGLAAEAARGGRVGSPAAAAGPSDGRRGRRAIDRGVAVCRSGCCCCCP